MVQKPVGTDSNDQTAGQLQTVAARIFNSQKAPTYPKRIPRLGYWLAQSTAASRSFLARPIIFYHFGSLNLDRLSRWPRPRTSTTLAQINWRTAIAKSNCDFGSSYSSDRTVFHQRTFCIMGTQGFCPGDHQTFQSVHNLLVA